MLFRMTFRKMAAQEEFIEARNLEYARKVAEIWCQQNQAQFVSIRPAAIAGEEILDKKDRSKYHQESSGPPPPPKENPYDLDTKI